jgi:hypothetical protein
MNDVSEPFIDIRVEPDRYRHRRVGYDGPVATATMQVTPEGGLRGDDDALETNCSPPGPRESGAAKAVEWGSPRRWTTSTGPTRSAS